MLQVSKQEGLVFLLCVYTNIYISHHCLFKKMSESRQLLPSSFHFPQIGTYTGQKRVERRLLYDLFLSATCCPSLDVILVEGMHCCSRLVSTACLYFVPGKCLHRQHLPVVHMSSISTQIQVWCIDTVSNMLAGWRTQDSHKCWESFVYLDRSVL